VDERLEEVPGFGECQHCPFNTSGPAELCYACARQTMEPLADVRCMVCDRPFSGEDTTCRNPLCNRSSRSFQWNYAIAMRSGQLERAINRYKYRDRRGWALVFGRVLSGFLEEEAEVFRQFDVITASPTYTGPGGRDFDHTRLVLQRAGAEVSPWDEWPFDIEGEPIIVKTRSTPKMQGHSYQERRAISEEELRDSLQVTRKQSIRNQRVLVYDDVFTDGLTLNEVARALRLAGAVEVCGVTLCRQPYRGQQ
jgi:predicted amidophosphoribosyltransferase